MMAKLQLVVVSLALVAIGTNAGDSVGDSVGDSSDPVMQHMNSALARVQKAAMMMSTVQKVRKGWKDDSPGDAQVDKAIQQAMSMDDAELVADDLLKQDKSPKVAVPVHMAAKQAPASVKVAPSKVATVQPHKAAQAVAPVVQAVAPVAKAVQAAALPTSIDTSASLEGAVSDLMKIGDLGLSATEFAATPFGSSVGKIQSLIEKDMMPKVLGAHSVDQKELIKLAAMVAKCGSTKRMQIKATQRERKLYKKVSPIHITCRRGEAALFTEKELCWEDEADKEQVKKLRCKEFAMVEKKYANQKQNKVIVSKSGGESAESYIRRLSATICGKPHGKGLEGSGKKSFLDEFLKAKIACEKATKVHKKQKLNCQRLTRQHSEKKKECNNLQDKMDLTACKLAVDTKDACEAYAECYHNKRENFEETSEMVHKMEKDRVGEWRGLKRMQCLVRAFGDAKVTSGEILKCKMKKHSTTHLIIKYPKVPGLVKCAVPREYPTTAEYKKAQFAPLPAMAKGKQDANECTGVAEINTNPAKGSPKTCKCDRVTLNGPFSPGPLVKCVNCRDIRRTADKSSCPDGTKLFSPRSRTDWKTFIASARPLRAPNWIIDVTRPQNGCGGCTRNAMNSANKAQQSWKTQDDSPWWLRSTRYNEPNGDYHANCFLDLWHTPRNSNSVTWNDGSCSYHAKSYYCQLALVSLTPKKGSPRGCMCSKIELAGSFSAGTLIKCKGCLDVRKATQKNSCPVGTKIFAPATRNDWKTFIKSATPLRSPHWIIDVTRPQNGCGGCTRHAMNSKTAAQATWRTADGAAWWLRSSRYSEPNGDYNSNCYLDLWRTPANENSVTWNDGRCNYHANSYYCQKARKIKKR